VTDNLAQTNRSTEFGRKKEIYGKKTKQPPNRIVQVFSVVLLQVLYVWGVCVREIRQSGKKKEELTERGKERKRERGDKRRQEEKRWAKVVMIETSGGVSTCGECMCRRVLCWPSSQQPCVIPTEPPRTLSRKYSFPPAEGKPPPPPPCCHCQSSAQENFKERRNNPHNKQVEEEMNKGRC